MDDWDKVVQDECIKAGVYLRVSTLDQKEGHGIELQKTKCEAMALVKGWTVSKVYKDEGVSGTIKETERPGFAQLIKDAKAKKIGAVIVYAMDRLGRRTQIVLRTIEKLSEMGINVVSCRENLDTSTATGTFMVTIFAALSQLERDTIVERMTAGIEERRKIDGDIGGHMPMGYKRAHGTVIIEDAKAEVVRYIFERRFHYFRFYDEIAMELNDRGAPLATKRSKEWTCSAVRKILDNEAKYLGGYRNRSKFRWPRILPLDFKEKEEEALKRKNEACKLDLPVPEGKVRNQRYKNFKGGRNPKRSKRALEQLIAMQKDEVLPRHSKIEIRTPKIVEDDTIIARVPRTPSPVRTSSLKIRIPSPTKREDEVEPSPEEAGPKIRIPSPPKKKSAWRKKKVVKNRSSPKSPKVERKKSPEIASLEDDPSRPESPISQNPFNIVHSPKKELSPVSEYGKIKIPSPERGQEEADISASTIPAPSPVSNVLTSRIPSPQKKTRKNQTWNIPSPKFSRKYE